MGSQNGLHRGDFAARGRGLRSLSAHSAFGCTHGARCLFPVQSDRLMGEITYSSYLPHFPRQLALALIVVSGVLSPEAARSGTSLALYLVLHRSFAGTYWWFEMPVQAKLRRFFQRISRRRTASTGDLSSMVPLLKKGESPPRGKICSLSTTNRAGMAWSSMWHPRLQRVATLRYARGSGPQK